MRNTTSTISGQSLTQERLRTPRAAALAGIIFALLLGTSVVLVYTSIPANPPFDPGWLRSDTSRLSLAVGLIPFAGIAFLWFMGVIRDQLGDLEDQFFSTVFLGSGLLMLSGIFVWMAVMASVLASYAAAPETWAASNASIFGRAMIRVTGGVVTLRMAGVFMFSSGTIWSRTKVMPKWIVWLTFIMALTLLIGGPSLRWLRMGFPLWVLVISLFLLRAGQGKMIHEEDDAAPAGSSEASEDADGALVTSSDNAASDAARGA